MKITVKHRGTEVSYNEPGSYSHQSIIDLLKNMVEQIIKLQKETDKK